MSLYLDNVVERYKKAAPKYDQFYNYVYSEKASITVRWLDLSTNDRLADVGGGTGGISTLVWKEANLSNPVLVVDPSPDMLEIAKSKQGVQTMLATFADLIASEHFHKYNKFVLIGCVLLIPQLSMTLENLFTKMSQGSQVLIVEHSKPVLWKSARDQVRQLSIDDMECYLSNAGFVVERGKEEYIRTYDKVELFQKIRQRCYSVLSKFSDEEIEEGIAELDSTIFNGASSKEIIDEYYMLKGTK